MIRRGWLPALALCLPGALPASAHGRGIDTGLGAAVTLDTHPSSLNSVYGSGASAGFEVFVRLRPSRLKAGMGVGKPGHL